MHARSCVELNSLLMLDTDVKKWNNPSNSQYMHARRHGPRTFTSLRRCWWRSHVCHAWKCHYRSLQRSILSHTCVVGRTVRQCYNMDISFLIFCMHTSWWCITYQVDQTNWTICYSRCIRVYHSVIWPHHSWGIHCGQSDEALESSHPGPRVAEIEGTIIQKNCHKVCFC